MKKKKYLQTFVIDIDFFEFAYKPYERHFTKLLEVSILSEIVNIYYRYSKSMQNSIFKIILIMKQKTILFTAKYYNQYYNQNQQ